MKIYLLLLGIAVAGWWGCGNPEKQEQANQPPQILEVRITPSIIVRNQSTTVYCRCTDPEQDALSYEWSAIFGSFFGSDSVVTWVAPDFKCEIYLKCTVSDAAGNTVSDSALVKVLADSLEG